MEFSWSQFDWNIIYNKQINLKIIMFSFHTHEVLSSIHKVESDFWEEMLDKLYSKVVQKHKSCLGLISNTIKTKPNDKVGEFSENTQFLFKSKINPEKHDLLLLIEKISLMQFFRSTLLSRRMIEVIFTISKRNMR